MSKVKKAHYVTHQRRKAGEFKGHKCIICGKPERIEHHPDYDRPFYSIPVCSEKHHRKAAIRFST